MKKTVGSFSRFVVDSDFILEAISHYLDDELKTCTRVADEREIELTSDDQGRLCAEATFYFTGSA